MASVTHQALLMIGVFAGETDTSTTPGAGTQVVPAGATTMVGEAWGGGGSGGGFFSGAAPGGSGCGYSKFTIAVTPGQTIYYTVGAGGVAGTGTGNDGGVSWVNPAANVQPAVTGCVGGGGFGLSNTGPLGGAGTIGTTNFSGGNGVVGVNPNGGGGGGGAGSAGNGGNASGITAGIAGTPDGGAGSAGGNASSLAGAQPGGGSGGAWNGTSAKGGDGKVKLTFT